MKVADRWQISDLTIPFPTTRNSLFTHVLLVCCESHSAIASQRLRNKAKLAAFLIPFTLRRNRRTCLDGYKIENKFFWSVFRISLIAAREIIELFVYGNVADVCEAITDVDFIRQLADEFKVSEHCLFFILERISGDL